LQKQFGVLFQNGALFSSLSVIENVKVPLREHAKLDAALMTEIANYKLAMVGLGPEAADKLPNELSGGMRKRAALARALALDPKLLFLDEPTAGLDPIGAAAFDMLICDLSKALGITVFLITHDLDTLHAICDRVAVLADHRVLVAAPIAELLGHAHPWIQSYFNGPRGRAAAASAAASNGSRIDA
jgi:phospholipid/cholesterol/gamma-HCH transport system ATP-binding protein